jgi:hypothetical protein
MRSKQAALLACLAKQGVFATLLSLLFFATRFAKQFGDKCNPAEKQRRRYAAEQKKQGKRRPIFCYGISYRA